MRVRILALTRAVIMAAVVAAPIAGVRADEAPGSRLGPSGFGRIVYGVTPAQLTAAGVLFTATAPSRGSTCHYLTLANSHGLRFLVEDGNVRRGEVSSASIATVDGFHVGDASSKVERFYASHASSRPDKYDASATVLTIDTGRYRTLFKVGEGSVHQIYSGIMPQVDYVEGCS